MSINFHIGISYQENIPDDFIEELTNSISIPELQVKVESREIGTYATIEWALPSLIIAYLSKPYFESFLKEAGKDHYQLLKKGLLFLFTRIFGKNPEKRDEKRSQLFSIMAQLDDGRSLKFVFPEGVSLEDYEKSLELMYSLLSQHYENCPSDQITEMTTRLSTLSHSLYMEYKAAEESWVIIDPLVEAKKAREAQNEHNKAN